MKRTEEYLNSSINLEDECHCNQREMQDLSTYLVDSLIGNLCAHEVNMLFEKVGSDSNLYKQGLVFKALLVDQESDDEDLNEELLSLNNSEVAFLSR